MLVDLLASLEMNGQLLFSILSNQIKMQVLHELSISDNQSLSKRDLYRIVICNRNKNSIINISWDLLKGQRPLLIYKLAIYMN